MSDAATTLWALCDHTQGERSFKRNGLTNALDGTEDHLISRTARVFWCELGMSQVRSQIEAEVDAFIASSTDLTPRSVLSSLQDYSSVPGGLGNEMEGQEIQQALQPGELPYKQDKENSDESISSDLKSVCEDNDVAAVSGDTIPDEFFTGDVVPPDGIASTDVAQNKPCGDVVLQDSSQPAVLTDSATLGVLISVSKK